MIGVVNRDPLDLARSAKVSASSHLSRIAIKEAEAPYPLERDIAVLMPADPGLSGELEWLIDAKRETDMTVEVWSTGRPENYVPAVLEFRTSVRIMPGQGQWVPVQLDWRPAEPQTHISSCAKSGYDAVSVIKPMSGACLRTGTAARVSKELEDHDDSQPVVEWSMKGLVRRLFCLRSAIGSNAYHPEHVIDGYKRPFGGPHMWVSERIADGETPWLKLEWEEARAIREIHLIFNDDVNEDLINLHHHRTPFDIIPELACTYRVEALDSEGNWVMLASEAFNRRRKRVHRLEEPIQSTALRLVVESTNGSDYAEVIEVRAYG